MIAAVRGEVMVRRADHVVIDAAGVGYRLTVSAETLKAVPATGREAFLHAELIAREDSLALYGFSSEEERDLFRLLISVSGVGPGTCSRPGGLRFQSFIDELVRHHSIGGWHMAPQEAMLRVGDVLSAFNSGGEAHTFTEVEAFGGGNVQFLNDILGLTTVAPECAQAHLLAPGQSSDEVEEEEGVEKYQCCIHPWMRAEVRIVEK